MLVATIASLEKTRHEYGEPHEDKDSDRSYAHDHRCDACCLGAVGTPGNKE